MERQARFSCGERKCAYLSSSKLEYISKFNALRRAGKEKDKEILAINEQISTKLQELKIL